MKNPGTRIPALVISPFIQGPAVVDHTQYDTTSILATIEQRLAARPPGWRGKRLIAGLFHCAHQVVIRRALNRHPALRMHCVRGVVE